MNDRDFQDYENEDILGEKAKNERRNHTLRRIALIFAILLGAIDLVATGFLFKLTSDEANKRQTENCRLFVARYEQDLDQISQTQKYLASLTPKEKLSPLNRRIADQLPTTISRAQVDLPPEYCGKQYIIKPAPKAKKNN